MSDKFQFKNNTLSLTLCNQPFELTLDEKTIGICDRIRSDARDFIVRLNDESTDTDTAISNICIFFEASVDSLLGKGATKTIFGTRPMKLLDLTDLLGFILSRMGEAVAARYSHTEA